MRGAGGEGTAWKSLWGLVGLGHRGWHSHRRPHGEVRRDSHWSQTAGQAPGQPGHPRPKGANSSRSAGAPGRGPGPVGHATPFLCHSPRTQQRPALTRFSTQPVQPLWPHFLFLGPLPQPSVPPRCAALCLPGRPGWQGPHGAQACTLEVRYLGSHPPQDAGRGQDGPSQRRELRSKVRVTSPSSHKACWPASSFPPFPPWTGLGCGQLPMLTSATTSQVRAGEEPWRPLAHHPDGAQRPAPAAETTLPTHPRTPPLGSPGRSQQPPSLGRGVPACTQRVRSAGRLSPERLACLQGLGAQRQHPQN